MIGATGNRVGTLHREAIGDYALPADLPPGGWRWLEIVDLQQLEQSWRSTRSCETGDPRLLTQAWPVEDFASRVLTQLIVDMRDPCVP